MLRKRIPLHFQQDIRLRSITCYKDCYINQFMKGLKIGQTRLLQPWDDLSTTCFRPWIELMSPNRRSFSFTEEFPTCSGPMLFLFRNLATSSIGVTLLILTSMVNAECPAKPVNEGWMNHLRSYWLLAIVKVLWQNLFVFMYLDISYILKDRNPTYLS